MLENGYNLGGEQSGHVIFLDDNTTGDGLLSALHLLQVMVETKKKLSELAQIMEVLPQALVNAKVPNHKKESYMEYSEIAEAIGELEKKFAGEGRVLIRPSGTRLCGMLSAVHTQAARHHQYKYDEHGRYDLSALSQQDHLDDIEAVVL